MELDSTICNNLWYRIDDLEKEVAKRGNAMTVLEAKMFNDHLTSICDKMTKYESEMEITLSDPTMLTNMLYNYRLTHMKALNLKINLAKIFFATESTPVTKTKLENQSNATTKLPETATNLDSQIRKQRFLIKQIESLEIPDDICAIKADVLYNHLSQLYATFISNQMEIEATLDKGDIFDQQQKIAKEIQHKVIDLNTKLKKITRPVESTSVAEPKTNFIDHSSQATQTNAQANHLNSLFKKQKSLIKRIAGLFPEEEICSEKAKVIYDHLSSLYEAFNNTQTEIEPYISGVQLDSQLETSTKVQNEVIDFQTSLIKIFAPIESSSSTQSEAFQSEKINSPESENNVQRINLALSDLLTPHNDSLNISTTPQPHLEIPKDTQKKMPSSRDTIKISIIPEDAEDLKKHILDLEKGVLNRLDEIESSVKDCKNLEKYTIDRLHNIESSLDKIENIVEDCMDDCNKKDPLDSEKILQFFSDVLTRNHIRTTLKASQSENINSPESDNHLQSTHLKLSDLVTSCNALLNIPSSLEHHLAISKDMQHKMYSFGKALKLNIDDTEAHKKGIFDKLDKLEGEVKDSKDREKDVLDKLAKIEGLVQDCKNHGKYTIDSLHSVEGFMERCEDLVDKIEELTNESEKSDDSETDSEDSENANLHLSNRFEFASGETKKKFNEIFKKGFGPRFRPVNQ